MNHPKDCPFCRSNGLLKGGILATTERGYLIENHFAPGNYLIIPEEHVEALTDLPDMWWKDVKKLLTQIPGLVTDYNISINIGKQAGQTIKHIHIWVVPRSAGKASSEKGLLSLIDQRDAAAETANVSRG